MGRCSDCVWYWIDDWLIDIAGMVGVCRLPEDEECQIYDGMYEEDYISEDWDDEN